MGTGSRAGSSRGPTVAAVNRGLSRVGASSFRSATLLPNIWRRGRPPPNPVLFLERCTAVAQGPAMEVAAGRGWHQPRSGHSRLQGHRRDLPVRTSSVSPLPAFLLKSILPGRPMEMLADIGGGQAPAASAERSILPCCAMAFPSRLFARSIPLCHHPPCGDPRAGHPAPGRGWTPVHFSSGMRRDRGHERQARRVPACVAPAPPPQGFGV